MKSLRMFQEWGLWKEGIRKQCEAVSKEDTETDAEFNARKELNRCERGKIAAQWGFLKTRHFLHEKSQLKIEITKRGHECILYPEFHCELNYIEYYWGAVMRYTRENCNYSFIEPEHTCKPGVYTGGCVSKRQSQWGAGSASDVCTCKVILLTNKQIAYSWLEQYAEVVNKLFPPRRSSKEIKI